MQECIDGCKDKLGSILLPPTAPSDTLGSKSGEGVRQAMKDLKRERVFVNGIEVVGRVLGNKRELVDVIKSALKKGFVEEKRRRRRGGGGEGSASDISSDLSSASDISDREDTPYPSSDTSNGAISTDDSESDNRTRRRKPPPRPMCRPRKFDTSKVRVPRSLSNKHGCIC